MGVRAIINAVCGPWLLFVRRLVRPLGYLGRITLECTYRSHSRESSQAVHTHSPTIRTLFAQYSHSRRIVFTSYSNTIRTLFARSHTIRTIAHYSHTIRSVALYSHNIRAVRKLFAPPSHQSCTLFARVRTSVTLFARWGEPARSTHSRTIRANSRSSHPFAIVNMCDIYTLV